MTWPAARKPLSEAKVEPLAAHLTKVEADEARVSHIVFDRRVSQWLRTNFNDAQMRLARHRFDGPVVLLRCELAEGQIDLVLEKNDVGAAIEMTLDLPERDLACQVLTALFRPLTQRLQPLLTGIRVTGFEIHPRWPECITVHTRGLRIGLARADDRVAEHVAGGFAGVPSANLASLAPMRVRARLQLLTRRWSREVMAEIFPGDVVLLPCGAAQARPRRLEARLIFGMGVTMEASAEISMDDNTVQVTDGAFMTNDDGEAGEAIATPLDALQLPVSFEIDTARISLAEMADIQPGYVVELDVPLPEATVRLICHGQTVGVGQLVAVGSQLGVRIVRMGLQHDTLAQR